MKGIGWELIWQLLEVLPRSCVYSNGGYRSIAPPCGAGHLIVCGVNWFLSLDILSCSFSLLIVTIIYLRRVCVPF